MMEIVWAVIFLAGVFALLVDSLGSLSKDIGVKELNERVEELERQLDILFDYMTRLVESEENEAVKIDGDICIHGSCVSCDSKDCFAGRIYREQGRDAALDFLKQFDESEAGNNAEKEK